MGLSVKQKMLLSFTSAIVSCLGCGAFLLYYSNSVSTRVMEETTANTENLEQLAEVRVLFGHQVQEWKNTLLRGADYDAFTKHSKSFDESVESMKKKVDQLGPKLRGEEKKLLDKFAADEAELAKAYQAARSEFFTASVFAPEKADKAVKGLDRKVLDSLGELSEILVKNTRKLETDARELLHDIFFWGVVAMGGVALICSAIFILVFRTLSNLDRQLLAVVKQLSQEGGELSSAASTVAETSADLAQKSEEQASFLQETSGSMEEISAMVAKNAEAATNTQGEVEQNQQAIQEGHSALQDMLRSLKSISESNDQIIQRVENSNKQFEDILNVIANIVDKTRVINDIVFQTKLLSFNASVEAARAGEQGKGFAVVAEEVGNLANMSGNAAKEISEMLNQSLSKVRQITDTSKSTINEVVASSRKLLQEGDLKAQRCGSMFETITHNSKKTYGIFLNIAESSKEQSIGVGQVNTAVTRLNGLMNEYAELAQRMNHASSSINERSDSLQEMMVSLNRLLSGEQQRGEKKVAPPKPQSPDNVFPLKKAA